MQMFLKETVSSRAAAIRIKCFILFPISGVAMRAKVRSRVCRGQKRHQNSNGFKTKTQQGGQRVEKTHASHPLFSLHIHVFQYETLTYSKALIKL